MAREYDAVVVGSGPGGASAARELAKSGKKVAVLEAGPELKWTGSHLSVLPNVDLKNALPLGHAMMIRGITLGGSSLIYCGTATKPAAFIKERTGIDLMPLADEFEEELGIAPLPDSLIGDAAKIIMEAANALGIDWKPLPKFINPEKCVRDCGECMLGCKRGAKWTAREFVRQARDLGADLYTRTRVERVLHENGVVAGVEARGSGGTFRAERVVIAAGGLGTPVILKRSGIEEAGQGFFTDPLLFTYGSRPERGKGSIYDIPMSAGTWQFHESEGLVMTDLAEPWLMQLSSMGLKLPPRVDQALNVRNILGIMTKVKDPVSGTIDQNGKLRKKLERPAGSIKMQSTAAENPDT